MRNPITLLLVLILPAWNPVHSQKLDQYRYNTKPGIPDNSISEHIRFNDYTDYRHDSYHSWYRYGNLFKMEVPDVPASIAQNKVDMAEELGIPGLTLQEGNLAYGDLDYSVMSALLAFPLIDVCRLFTSSMEERGSFPGGALGPVNGESEEELVARMGRIDYILVSPQLSIKCRAAKVCNGEENHYLSDHYPVLAEFDLKQK